MYHNHLLVLRRFIQRSEPVYQLLTNLELVLSIGLDHDVCGRLIFLAALFHEFCDIVDIFIALKQRTVMVILDTVQDRLRLCGQKDNPSVFLHLDNIAFPHRYIHRHRR